MNQGPAPDRHPRQGKLWRAAAVLLAAGLAISLYCGHQAAQARDQAAYQADAAAAVSAFWGNQVLGSSDPFTAGAPTLTVRKALDQAIAGLEAQFAGRPAVEAAVHAAIARVLARQPDLAAAEQQGRRALALYPPGDGATQVSRLIASYELALTLGRLSRQAEAAGVMARADDEAAGLLRRQPALAIVAKHTHGDLLLLKQEISQATPLLESAMRLQLAYQPGDLDAIWALQQSLIEVYTRGARYQKAEEIATQMLESRVRVQGEHSMGAAYARVLLGQSLASRGEFKPAEAQLQRAYADAVLELGPTNDRLALALTPLVNFYTSQQRYQDAAPLAARLQALTAARLGAQNPVVLNALGDVGIVEYMAGDLEQAATHLRQARDGLAPQIGESHPATQMIGFYLAQATLDLGRTDGVDTLLSQLSATGLKAAGAGNDWSERLELLRAKLLLRQGRKAEARPLIEHAVAAMTQRGSPAWVLGPARRLLEESGG